MCLSESLDPAVPAALSRFDTLPEKLIEPIEYEAWKPECSSSDLVPEKSQQS